MRLDVRVEGGKGRVPSEIGTEPDRVGISAFIDGQARGAIGALAAASKVSVVEVDRFTTGRAKAAAVEIRELRAPARRPTGSSSTHSQGACGARHWHTRSTSARQRIRHGIRHTAALVGRGLRPCVANAERFLCGAAARRRGGEAH